MVKAILGLLALVGLAAAAAKKKTSGPSDRRDDEQRAAPSEREQREAVENKSLPVAERVARALASGSAKLMRELADALEREGHKDAARDLRAAAEALDDEPAPKREAPRLRDAPKREEPRREEPRREEPRREEPRREEPREPIDQKPPGPVPEDPQRALALQLTNHLKAIGGLAGRYKEDRALVLKFQNSDGVSADDDGKYGPATARRILDIYGIIPVVPYYWSKNNWQTQKRDFSAAVTRAKSGDMRRAAEYDALLKDVERS